METKFWRTHTAEIIGLYKGFPDESVHILDYSTKMPMSSFIILSSRKSTERYALYSSGGSMNLWKRTMRSLWMASLMSEGDRRCYHF